MTYIEAVFARFCHESAQARHQKEKAAVSLPLTENPQVSTG
jgi:hypothetical protein